MKHSIDEILLQRCVDGELSDHERTDLLARLNEQGSVENWKTLALSFVEHQVFSKVFMDGAASGEMDSFQLARPAPAPVEEASSRNRHWLHRRVRPWFSIAASLAMGMLVGVGGHFLRGTGDSVETDLASTAPVSAPVNQVAGSPRPSSSQTPMMNVHLTGLGNGGAEPVSVPVYSPEQWHSLQSSDRLVQLPEELQHYLKSQGMTVDHERQWYRARLNDGREILVPTETMRVRHAVQ